MNNSVSLVPSGQAQLHLLGATAAPVLRSPTPLPIAICGFSRYEKHLRSDGEISDTCR